jgi:succinate dehydrogenase hydrophobic anchor subunit
MQNPWLKLVDAALVVSALYHGGYGLISMLNDYAAAKIVRGVGMAAITVAMAIACWTGIKLIVSI